MEILLIGILFGMCLTSVQSACPANCLANFDCDAEPDGGCPQCTEAYYGRQCQYRMECRFTEKGEEYRGLLNTTRGGYTCLAWNASISRWPNSEGNYCRNPDSDTEPWCLTTNSSKRWDYCDVPLCAQSSCPTNCLANSDCDAEPDGGCSRCTEAYYGRQCQYRMECRFTEKGEEYRGLLNTTRGGYTCLAWNASISRYTNSEGNYCRNPDSDTEPWCLTTNSSKRWDYCDVPKCGDLIMGVTWNASISRYTNSEGNYCRNPDSDTEPWCLTTNSSKRWDYCDVPKCGSQCIAPPQPPGSELLNPAKPGEGFYDGYTSYVNISENFTIYKYVCSSLAWANITCAVIKCGRPTLKNNTCVIDPQYDFGYDTEINIVCNTGYELHGNSIIKCLQNDTCSGSVPICSGFLNV